MAFDPVSNQTNAANVPNGYPNGHSSSTTTPVQPSENIRQRMNKREVHAECLFVRTRMKKWKARYCVLYSDRTLSYWNSPHDLEYSLPPKGSIDLSTTRYIETKTKITKQSQNHRRTMSLSNDESMASVSKQYSLDFSTLFRDKSRKDSHEFSSEQKEEERQSHRQFKFKIVQSKKGYSFYTEDMDKCKEWIRRLKFVIFGRMIFSGYLFHLAEKKRKGTHEWKRRYFVLYDRKELRYYEKDNESIPLGMMALPKLKTLRKSEDRKAKATYGQYLYLIKFEYDKRTVIVSSLEESERDEWYSQIHSVIFSENTNGIASIANKEISPRHNQRGSKYDGITVELLPPVESPSNTPRLAVSASTDALGSVKLPIVRSDKIPHSGHRSPRSDNSERRRRKPPPRSAQRSQNRTPNRSPNRSPRHSRSGSPRRSSRRTPPPRRRAKSKPKDSRENLRIPGDKSPSLRSSKSYNPYDDRKSPTPHSVHSKSDKLDLRSLRKEVAELKEELTFLKIQCVMSGVNRNGLVESVEDVDDELLDCDQYLILDRDWRHWTYLEIVDWIINIEHGRFRKWKFVLFANMKFREFRGRDLAGMEKTDLTNFFGVTHFGDVTAIWKHIRSLIRN